MIDIVERLQYWAFKFCGKGEREDIASDAMTDGWQEIERLRKANKRLGEIATDAVGWLPPASVNGPREEYQNEIKELT
jgi:hypothetical protein